VHALHPLDCAFVLPFIVIVRAIRFATLKVTFCHCLVFPARVLVLVVFYWLLVLSLVSLPRGGWACSFQSTQPGCSCIFDGCNEL
jgi:hypothetical protein